MLAPSVSGSLYPVVVVAVLRDSLCAMSLLPCVADCYMLYIVCKVERSVVTIIKRRLLCELDFADVISHGIVRLIQAKRRDRTSLVRCKRDQAPESRTVRPISV